MNNKTIERDYREIVNVYKSLIEINKKKLRKYFGDMFDNIENNIKKYKKSNLLGDKYYSLLDNIGKFINKNEIDVTFINKSIINKINNHCKICSLTKVCFSEPENEINDNINEDDELNSDHGEDDISEDDENDVLNSDHGEDDISEDDEDDKVINESNKEK